MISPRASLALATFLCLVPVTLVVPGLHELVVVAQGGSEQAAHAFMTINMVAGMITVPATMVYLRKHPHALRRLAMGLLLLDTVAFIGLGLSPNLATLMAFRVLDGATHLPALTLLMVASNRTAREGRGGALGALATAIMVGVAVGSPLGGRLVERGPEAVYFTGAVLLLLAVGVVGLIPRIEAGLAGTSRYQWDRRRREAWVPLAYAFLDRFSSGIFVSTFTLYLTNVAGLTPSQRGALVALFMGPFALLCYPAGRLADRIGWFAPLLAGNILFALTFASYGFVPNSWLPGVMVASGVFSAMMFAPNLLLVSELARRGVGEGLFGAFQVAGSLGFLTGPIVGGILVTVTRDASGTPAYRAIFAVVGLLAVLVALASWRVCRGLAREVELHPTATIASP